MPSQPYSNSMEEFTSDQQDISLGTHYDPVAVQQPINYQLDSDPVESVEHFTSDEQHIPPSVGFDPVALQQITSDQQYITPEPDFNPMAPEQFIGDQHEIIPGPDSQKYPYDPLAIPLGNKEDEANPSYLRGNINSYNKVLPEEPKPEISEEEKTFLEDLITGDPNVF